MLNNDLTKLKRTGAQLIAHASVLENHSKYKLPRAPKSGVAA